MLQTLDGIGFQSTLLLQLDGVIHGFSNRFAGDMDRSQENRNRFALNLGFKSIPILAEQVYGNRVQRVDRQVLGIVSGVDGLVSRNAPVAVVVADCVPLLLVDPVERIYAAVHAGWKGTLGGIAGNAVKELVGAGGDARRMYVAIGPHIGGCCYGVSEDRARAFVERFGKDEKMVFTIQGLCHLDIGWANYRQLLAAGVPADHIDAPLTCTSCQNNKFFSYRKDSKGTYGEMMAVIGLK